MTTVTDMGEIPLRNKHIPTSELPLDHDIGPLVTWRHKNVNIHAIQDRIRQLESEFNIWHPDHQKDNVPIRRAGHDVWGIDKIMLIFCDDYMKNIYRFPWLEKWLNELTAIFNLMDISLDRVVRCLFARMPGGSTIPVHNDTGYWVDKCHRIHVPIFTNEKINFQVGRNEDTMIQYDFAENGIYELNNASKHKVFNGSDIPRIHLIFDYVDFDYPISTIPLIQLKPNMILNQTRRSVDLSSAYGSRSPPSFLIIGAQKAGTTSLYDYITQHDLVVSATRKETHYLDWRWDHTLPSIDTREGIEKHRAQYHRFFPTNILFPNPSILTGEATPSYMLGGSIVINRLKALAPDVKILIVLRNPVDRAFSHYNMTADPHGNPEQLRNRGHTELGNKSFDEIIDEEIAQLNALGVHPDMSFTEFDSIYLKNRVKYHHGGHSFVGRGLYALQILGWYETFSMNQLKIINMDDMKTSNGLQNILNEIFHYLDIPSYIIQDNSPKNTRKYNSMNINTRKKLENFFLPFNRKLNEIIKKSNFSWTK